MAKNRLAKVEGIEEQITRLQNQRKLELQKHRAEERKARNSRLCRRHGLLEKFMPTLATITDEQFEVFIKTGIDTTYGRNKLAEIVAKAEASTTQQTAEPPQASTTAAKPKAETPPPLNGTNGSAAEPPTAARSGA
jgi:hypothetical protein